MFRTTCAAPTAMSVAFMCPDTVVQGMSPLPALAPPLLGLHRSPPPEGACPCREGGARASWDLFWIQVSSGGLSKMMPREPCH